MSNDISEELLLRYLDGDHDAIQEVVAIIVERDRPEETQ